MVSTMTYCYYNTIKPYFHIGRKYVVDLSHHAVWFLNLPLGLDTMLRISKSLMV